VVDLAQQPLGTGAAVQESDVLGLDAASDVGSHVALVDTTVTGSSDESSGEHGPLVTVLAVTAVVVPLSRDVGTTSRAAV
jgi:hypothetical protein